MKNTTSSPLDEQPGDPFLKGIGEEESLLFPDAFAPMTPERVEALIREALDKTPTVALAEMPPPPWRAKPRTREWFGAGECALVLLGMLLVLLTALVVRAIAEYPRATIWVTPISKSVSQAETLPGQGIVLSQHTVRLIQTRTMRPSVHGHQDAAFARGRLSLYNANTWPVPVPAGTIVAVSGLSLTTDTSVTIPAAVPPAFGVTHVQGTATRTGPEGNIAAQTLSGPCCGIAGVYVRNMAAFTGGARARDFLVVQATDLRTLSAQVTQALASALATAFPHSQEQAVAVASCPPVVSSTRQVGQEASTVSVTGTRTCQGITYVPSLLQARASAAYAATAPAPSFILTDVTVTPTRLSLASLEVRIRGLWVYRLSEVYLRFLATQIAGKSASSAHAFLLATGVIAQAALSLPTLPEDPDYLSFQVLSPR